MESVKRKILLVEDNPGDVILLLETFRRHGENEFELVHKPCLQDALKKISEEAVDVILLDLFLPESGGLETLVQVQKAAPVTPIIVLTGYYDERTTLHAITMGAQDYLAKDELDGDRLMDSLRYYLSHRGKGIHN